MPGGCDTVCHCSRRCILCSVPSSKFKDVGERLRPFAEEPEQHKLDGNPTQSHEEVSGLLEDVRETILNYQVCSQILA